MKEQKWTTANIPGLKGEVIIVTGGNSTGYESVSLEKGAEVILTQPFPGKGNAAKSESETPKAK